MNSGAEDYVPVSRQHLNAILDLIADGHDHDQRVRQAGIREGQAVKTGNGYQTGYDLGHDTGLAARQDTRSFVHGVLDGWAAGCQARHQLAAELTRRGPVAPGRGQAEAELEAGA